MASQSNKLQLSEECGAEFCVKAGDTLTISISCSIADPRATQKCIMKSGPPGATFTATVGNPSEGTMTWVKAGPPGEYVAVFNSITVFCPSDIICGADPPDLVSTIRVFANEAPDANAKVLPSNEVQSGTLVTLDGSSRTDKDDPPEKLRFDWKQFADDAVKVSLSNAKQPKATFTAPKVTSNTVLNFALTVSDIEGAFSAVFVKVTVKPATAPNAPPTANSQRVTTDQGAPKNIILTGSDPNNDPLTFKIVTKPEHGTLIGTGPSVLYRPDKDYVGADRFTFRVNDGKLDSSDAVVTIGVAACVPDKTTELRSDVSVNVVVCEPEEDFSIDCPEDIRVVKGETTDIECAISSIKGFDHPVDLSCKPLVDFPPLATSCFMGPAQVTPPANGEIKFTLTVSTTPGTPVGVLDLDILGKSVTPAIDHRVVYRLECASCLPRTGDQESSDLLEGFLERFEGRNGFLREDCSRTVTRNCHVTPDADEYGLYNDGNSLCTNGIGHLVHNPGRACDDQDIIDYNAQFPGGMTRAQALDQFEDDIEEEGEDPVNQGVTVELNQPQFDALVSFAFNIGTTRFNEPSRLLNSINAGECEPQTIQNGFNRFIRPNLQERRNEEARLFNYAIYPRAIGER